MVSLKASRSRKQGSPSRLSKVHPRERRFAEHSSVLREIKRFMKHPTAAIPRLPFQRLVRRIAERNGICFRWKASALFCLHEAAEDWLIEFFLDSYVLAAHAHRVTVMNKDFFSLAALRFRYDKLLTPVTFTDAQMVQILDVRPVQKIRIQEVTEGAPEHEHETRANIRAAANREHNVAMLALQSKRENVRALHEMNREALQLLLPEFYVPYNIRGQRCYLPIHAEEINILFDPRTEVNDKVLRCVLRYTLFSILPQFSILGSSKLINPNS